MVTHRDIDPLWWLSDKLTVVRRKLQEAQQWLAGHEVAWSSTPLPENTASPDRDANPRGKTASPAKLPVAATPKRDSIPLGKTTTPAKCLDVATLTKARSRPSMGSGSWRLKVAQQGTGPDEREGDESDNEEHDDTESSQGKEEVDEMLLPRAPARHGTQVAVQDTLEHVLVAGKWAGLGAVCKANKVHVKVSGLRPHRQVRVTEAHFQGQLVYVKNGF